MRSVASTCVPLWTWWGEDYEPSLTGEPIWSSRIRSANQHHTALVRSCLRGQTEYARAYGRSAVSITNCR